MKTFSDILLSMISKNIPIIESEKLGTCSEKQKSQTALERLVSGVAGLCSSCVEGGDEVQMHDF